MSLLPALLAFGGFLLALCALSGPAFGGNPAIIAHRGASGRAPENTRVAVQLAWELGADAAEIDIQLTADQRIVAIHDANAKRTTGVDLAVAQTPSERLRALDAGSFKSAEYAGEKIPFLEEIIATVPANRRLVVEIKCGTEILPFLAKVIENCGKRGHLVFIGFGFPVMRECKALMPDIPAYWLCMVDTADSSGTPALKSGDFRAPVPEALDAVKEAGLDGIDIGHAGVDAPLVKMVMDRGLDLLVWTVNDPARARELAAIGVRGITTDQPDVIREKMK
ncbi:MAG: glycerophosphodiester phosphodiesterase family protein [Candidatus Latescibacterota bacterium]